MWGMRFAAEGRELWTYGADPKLVIWDTATWRPVRRFSSPDPKPAVWEDLAVSADGTQLAITNWWAIRLTSVDQLTDMETLGAHGEGIRGLAFLPDGRRLFSLSGDRRQPLVLWDTLSRDRLAVLGTDQEQLTSMAISPSGRWLATGTAGGTTVLWDTDAQDAVLRLRSSLKKVDRVCFSPDGRTLAVIGPTPRSDRRDINLWDLEKVFRQNQSDGDQQTKDTMP